MWFDHFQRLSQSYASDKRNSSGHIKNQPLVFAHSHRS